MTPQPGKIPLRIIDKGALAAVLDALGSQDCPAAEKRRDLLTILKTTYRSGYDEIRRHCFEDKADGAIILRETCALTDQIIISLYDYVTRWVSRRGATTKGEQISVLAVGGYGRRELAPWSDIDLLFLMPHKITPYAEHVVEYILYILWDMGLKVGHATRSINECIQLAKKDHTIRTAMLDVRWLWGDKDLAGDFEKRYKAEVIAGTGVAFVEEKLAERNARHNRLGDSRYLLEPNIKEDKGGLRDLHTLFWIARYLFGITDIHDLVEQGIITAHIAHRFAKAQTFLWTVRSHLHFLTGRAEDRLSFDMQKIIARNLGYTNRSGAIAVERFMRHYFLIVKDVGDLTRIFCSLLEEQNKRRPRFWRWRRTVGDDFFITGNRISFKNETNALTIPLQMLRLFRQAQIDTADIHPNALKLIAENLKAIDTLRTLPEANALFLDMLTGNEPETTLRRMNEAGVLGRFIPEFGGVVAQMQYDMYHIYTTDEHTIRAIGILNAIETRPSSDDLEVTVHVIKTIASRRALYVAVLLHDIAKGRRGDHSELGAKIALKLGPRLGLSPEETDTVVWLVQQHLTMSRTAFKRDLDDIQTILTFADTVQSMERLKLLFLLTCVDIRAVGPKVWNGWKATLLRELYQRTAEALSGGHATEARDVRIERKKNTLRNALSDWPPDCVERFLSLGYPNYWLIFDTQTQYHHATLVRQAKEETRSLLIDIKPNPSQDVVDMTVLATDHPGLFSQLAGTISLIGCSIVDAKIVTLTNGMALDHFTLQDPKGELPRSESKQHRLRDTITKVLAGECQLASELIARTNAQPPKTRAFKIPQRVIFDNAASKTHTVLEVNGRDRPGFLYDITRTITDLGLQISSAHISTYGTKVVDVFYIKDASGMKIDHARKLKQIQDHLLNILAKGDDGGIGRERDRRPAETITMHTRQDPAQ